MMKACHSGASETYGTEFPVRRVDQARRRGLHERLNLIKVGFMQLGSSQPRRLDTCESRGNISASRAREAKEPVDAISEEGFPDLASRDDAKSLVGAEQMKTRCDAGLKDAHDRFAGESLELVDEGVNAVAGHDEAVVEIDLGF